MRVLNGKTLHWELTATSPVSSGEFKLPSTEGLFTAGELKIDLSAFDKPTKLQLCLSIEDTEFFGVPYHNTYDLWVYPAWSDLSKLESMVTVTNQLDELAISQLEKGKSVLLMPEANNLCVGGLFQTDYWNFRMFKTISEGKH